MKIAWLPEAARNLEHQLTYIGERNPSAAFTMGDAIFAAVDRLAAAPHSGRPGRVQGTRELIVTETPFIVIYQIEPTTVLILRVLHGAQLWPPEGS